MKKFWNELEDNICGILLLVMMLLTCVNVFARYVLLSSMPFVSSVLPAQRWLRKEEPIWA